MSDTFKKIPNYEILPCLGFPDLSESRSGYISTAELTERPWPWVKNSLRWPHSVAPEAVNFNRYGT